METFLILTICMLWVFVISLMLKGFADKVEFHSMDEFPEKIEGETISKDVLLYKEGELTFNELGFYDYEFKKWVTFSEYSNSFICWCYPPDAIDFVNAKNKLQSKIIEGCKFDQFKNIMNGN